MISGHIEKDNVSLHMRGQVLSEMEHAYLNRWLGVPRLDIFQMQAATAVLRAVNCPAQDLRLLCTVLLLIHHGLSAHEHIDRADALGEKTRQLQVLAGDYYSSKYFYLLAASGKVDLIAVFAKAITAINEAKTERADLLKRFTKVHMEHYITLSECIHGELLYALTSTFTHGNPLINDLTRVLVQTYIFVEEYHQFRDGQLKGNLSHVYLMSKANAEEVRHLRASETEIPDSKLLPLHVKYGTSAFLYSRVEEGLATIKTMLSLEESEEVRESLAVVCDLLGQTFQDTKQKVEER